MCIYLCCGPGGNYDHFDTISEGEAVTVLAEQNGYAYVNASGCCVSGKYSLEGRLTVDGIRFLWNGGEFVSTELQEMSGTWDHYKLIPGHTQFC